MQPADRLLSWMAEWDQAGKNLWQCSFTVAQSLPGVDCPILSIRVIEQEPEVACLDTEVKNLQIHCSMSGIPGWVQKEECADGTGMSSRDP